MVVDRLLSQDRDGAPLCARRQTMTRSRRPRWALRLVYSVVVRLKLPGYGAPICVPLWASVIGVCGLITIRDILLEYLNAFWSNPPAWRGILSLWLGRMGAAKQLCSRLPVYRRRWEGVDDF